MAKGRIRGKTPLISIGLSAAILSVVATLIALVLFLSTKFMPFWVYSSLSDFSSNPAPLPAGGAQFPPPSPATSSPSMSSGTADGATQFTNFGAAFVKATDMNYGGLSAYYSLPSGPVEKPLPVSEVRKLVGIGSSCSLEPTWAYPNRSRVKVVGERLVEVTVPLNCSDSQKEVTLRVDTTVIERNHGPERTNSDPKAEKTYHGIRGVLLEAPTV